MGSRSCPAPGVGLGPVPAKPKLPLSPPPGHEPGALAGLERAALNPTERGRPGPGGPPRLRRITMATQWHVARPRPDSPWREVLTAPLQRPEGQRPTSENLACTECPLMHHSIMTRIMMATGAQWDVPPAPLICETTMPRIIANKICNVHSSQRNPKASSILQCQIKEVMLQLHARVERFAEGHVHAELACQMHERKDTKVSSRRRRIRLARVR